MVTGYLFVTRMLLVRLSQEGAEGKFLKYNIIKHLWEDMEKRIKRFGVSNILSDSLKAG